MRNETNGLTEVCALIGHPVEHTMSPLLHNTLAEHTGVNMVYTAFDVGEKKLKNAISGAAALGVKGINVTVPHKNAIIPHLKSVDEEAKLIGAVNTLTFDKEKGIYHGTNTDYSGFKRLLEDEGITVNGVKAIVLGAGGVARAVCALFAKEGAKEVIIANRTIERATSLAKEMNRIAASGDVFTSTTIEALSAPEALPHGEKYLCVQCTSVGMFPNINEAPIEEPTFYEHIETGIDLIYRPRETRFLHLVTMAKGRAVGGLKMLLYQGIESFEQWFDVVLNDEQIGMTYEALDAKLTDPPNIVLIGFMGSGKSTIARILERQTGAKAVDTDERIEKKKKMTIPQMFETKGEEYFRKAETAYLSKTVQKGRTGIILAAGGGMPMREENRRLLRRLGRVVYLQASAKEIYGRIKDDKNRPLVGVENPKARIEELLDERETYYRMAADITIETDDRDPETIAAMILERCAKK